MGTQGFSLSDLLEKSGQEGGFLLQWCVIGEGDMDMDVFVYIV